MLSLCREGGSSELRSAPSSPLTFITHTFPHRSVHLTRRGTTSSTRRSIFTVQTCCLETTRFTGGQTESCSISHCAASIPITPQPSHSTIQQTSCHLRTLQPPQSSPHSSTEPPRLRGCVGIYHPVWRRSTRHQTPRRPRRRYRCPPDPTPRLLEERNNPHETHSMAADDGVRNLCTARAGWLPVQRFF